MEGERRQSRQEIDEPAEHSLSECDVELDGRQMADGMVWRGMMMHDVRRMAAEWHDKP
jgi:hypothetical protein